MKAGGEWTLPASFCIKKTPCYARGSESLSYGERKASYDKLEAGLAAAKEIKGGSLMKDNNSLAHTMYNCKYHIVFAMVFSITHRCVNFIMASCCSI